MKNLSVKKAIKKRDHFLNQNPHLKEYQKEIDRRLSKTPDELRFSVVALMISERLLALNKNISKIYNPS